MEHRTLCFMNYDKEKSKRGALCLVLWCENIDSMYKFNFHYAILGLTREARKCVKNWEVIKENKNYTKINPFKF